MRGAYPLEEIYTARLRLSHQVHAHRIDFGQPAKAREIINAWVEKWTRQRIKGLVPPGMPTPDTRLVLANASYLKAKWQHSFSVRATEDSKEGSGTSLLRLARRGREA